MVIGSEFVCICFYIVKTRKSMWTCQCYQASVLFRAEEETSEFLIRKRLLFLRGRGGGKGCLRSEECQGGGPLLRRWVGRCVSATSGPSGKRCHRLKVCSLLPLGSCPCARLSMPCGAAGLWCPRVERFCSSSLHSGGRWGGRCCCSLLGEPAVLGGVRGLQGDLVHHFSHSEPSFPSAFWVVEV